MIAIGALDRPADGAVPVQGKGGGFKGRIITADAEFRHFATALVAEIVAAIDPRHGSEIGAVLKLAINGIRSATHVIAHSRGCPRREREQDLRNPDPAECFSLVFV